VGVQEKAVWGMRGGTGSAAEERARTSGMYKALRAGNGDTTGKGKAA